MAGNLGRNASVCPTRSPSVLDSSGGRVRHRRRRGFQRRPLERTDAAHRGRSGHCRAGRHRRWSGCRHASREAWTSSCGRLGDRNGPYRGGRPALWSRRLQPGAADRSGWGLRAGPQLADELRAKAGQSKASTLSDQGRPGEVSAPNRWHCQPLPGQAGFSCAGRQARPDARAA